MLEMHCICVFLLCKYVKIKELKQIPAHLIFWLLEICFAFWKDIFYKSFVLLLYHGFSAAVSWIASV